MIDEKVLIERLEKHKAYNEKMLTEFPNMGTVEHAIYKTQRNTYERTIGIVKDLASERNNDFCEWKFEKTTGIVWHCDSECITYNLTYAKGLENYLKDFESKCPYCGKKIKVHEPEGE